MGGSGRSFFWVKKLSPLFFGVGPGRTSSPSLKKKPAPIKAPIPACAASHGSTPPFCDPLFEIKNVGSVRILIEFVNISVSSRIKEIFNLLKT